MKTNVHNIWEILPASQNLSKIPLTSDLIFRLYSHVQFMVQSCFYKLRIIAYSRHIVTVSFTDTENNIIHAFISSLDPLITVTFYFHALGLIHSPVFTLNSVLTRRTTVYAPIHPCTGSCLILELN